jgi:phosphoribosylformylglycinamidine synthase I
MPSSAVIVFPGSNCDRDACDALTRATGHAPAMLWHQEAELPKVDLVVLPGGFSYGDYLRSGAMAARSPVMRAVKKHAAAGRYVLGICNGFQVLTESGLLPGVLLRNAHRRFVCREVTLKVEQSASPFTRSYAKGQLVRFSIAHHDGNYFADAETLKKLEGEGQIAFRYCTASGEVVDAANPNGSVHGIAGITNRGGNVLGMMPHPERHTDALSGGLDGLGVFGMAT